MTNLPSELAFPPPEVSLFGDANWHTRLLDLVQSYDWPGALARIVSHPIETTARGPQGRTALHIACDHDAPAEVVKSLLAAYPEASSMVGTSDMNPLHITCSSQHASVHVVKVLLEGSPTGTETSMRDVDGDTPLHAACRCGAPYEVLEVLLKANPSVVLQRDYEGLTPLLRLWVRYFVMLGDDVIESVRGPEDMVGELGEAWEKTKLLLRAAHHGAVTLPEGNTFRVVHAVAAVDCPRAVLKIATILYPEQLAMPDEFGRLPLNIAATAPVYKVHDLSVDGYCYEEERLYGDGVGSDDSPLPNEEQNDQQTDCPSVIEVLLNGNPNPARIPDNTGRFPLGLAIESGKGWKEGLKAIFNAYPDALSAVDRTRRLYPFMIAAVHPSASVSTVYDLLKANPELVRGGIQQKTKRENEETNYSQTGIKSKRTSMDGSIRYFSNCVIDDKRTKNDTTSWRYDDLQAQTQGKIMNNCGIGQ